MFTLNKDTTVDDVIEHLIERLNTDYEDTYIEINHFCHYDESEENFKYDKKMAALVLDKMLAYDVAKLANHGFDRVILRPNGVKAHLSGGWKTYLKEVERQKSEKERLSRRSNISVGGNAIIGDNNSNNHLDSSLNFDIKSKKAIQQISIDTPNKKSNHTIWDKIKYVSVIIGGLAALLAAITKLLKYW